MNKRNFLLKYFFLFLALVLGLIFSKEGVVKILGQIKSLLGIRNESEVTGNSDEIYLELLKNKLDWINVQQPPYNLPGDGSDQSSKLQEVFNIAKEQGSVYLYFPEGDYGMSGYLRLYKNTFVKLHDKAKILRLGTGYKVFVNGQLGNDSYASGYRGEGNIHISGGTIDLNAKGAPIAVDKGHSAFDFGHSANISIRNLTIENGQNGHFIQLSSCKDVLIENCMFRDQIQTSTKSNLFEAIQIEAATKISFPSFGTYDETISKDITIENCTFENVIRAIGTHGDGTYGTVDIVYCENIRILNNNFIGSIENTLNLTAYKNTIVENNIIINAGGYGVYLVSFNDSIFKGNTIIGTQKSGIYLRNSNNNYLNINYYKDSCLDKKDHFPAVFVDNSNNNTFDGESVFSAKPNYSYAFFLKNGCLGNKILNRNFKKGIKGLINGNDFNEMKNLQIGLGQEVLYEGSLSGNGETATLLEDIRNFNFLVIVGIDNVENSPPIATMVIPKSVIVITNSEDKFRLTLLGDSYVEYSFPSTMSARIEKQVGLGGIKKIIGML